MLQAILVGLIACFVTFEWTLGSCLITRPIVTGVLVGLVMGDLQTGIIMGGTLELVFIGAVTLGAAVPPDVITGGILGTAFAISTGQGADVALTLAFPIATLYLLIDNAMTLFVMPFFLHRADRYVEQDDARGVKRMHFLGGFVVKSLPPVSYTHLLLSGGRRTAAGIFLAFFCYVGRRTAGKSGVGTGAVAGDGTSGVPGSGQGENI